MRRAERSEPGRARDAEVIAGSWTDPGQFDPGYTAMIIFNPRTGAFLGQRTTYRGESPAVYSGDAVVQRAVVDQPGQLPLGGAAR